MEQVVLLHGLGRTRASMQLMRMMLERAGFGTTLLGYASTSKSVAELTDDLFARLPETGRISFVGHSLGGILAKHLMLRLAPERRGRIVQLGAPNFGTEIAERVGFLAPIMGPVLDELEPNKGIDDQPLDIGAIAGTAAIDALSHLTGIAGENDGKISVTSAWGNAPEGKRVKFPVAHSTMMLNLKVIDATIRFLREGHF